MNVAEQMGEWALVSLSILMLPIAILWMAISAREERNRRRDYDLPGPGVGE